MINVGRSQPNKIGCQLKTKSMNSNKATCKLFLFDWMTRSMNFAA